MTNLDKQNNADRETRVNADAFVDAEALVDADTLVETDSPIDADTTIDADAPIDTDSHIVADTQIDADDADDLPDHGGNALSIGDTIVAEGPFFRWSNRGAFLGTVFAVALIGLIVWRLNHYLAMEEDSYLMLGLSFFSALLIIPVFAVKPNRKRKHYALYAAAVFFVTPLLAVAMVERMNGNFIWELEQYCYLDNYCIVLLLFCLTFALFGSVRITLLLWSPMLFLFGLANMYVKEFKGSPLLPADMGAISTAATVAKGYNYTLGTAVPLSIALLLILLALGIRTPMPKAKTKKRRRARLACFLIVGILAGLFYFTSLGIHWGYKPDFFNQMRGYQRYGAILEFFNNTRYLRLSAPKNYDAAEIEKIVMGVIDEKATSAGQGEKTVPSGQGEITAPSGQGEKTVPSGQGETTAPSGQTEKSAPSILETALTNQGLSDEEIQKAMAHTDSTVKRPHIIVVMNEAYSDLRKLGDFKTTQPIMPFTDSLTENTIKGTAYVSVLGTGTSNTEFEFLTGNTMAYLPSGSNAYQLYLKDNQPGLTSSLKETSYGTHALHPYFKANWNRPYVYDSMGFEDYLALEDFFGDALTNDYRDQLLTSQEISNRLGEMYPTDGPFLLRRYVSDAFNYFLVEDSYTKRDKSKPWFMFNITMQNHSPYDLYGIRMADTVRFEGDSYYPYTDQYLSLVRASDDALKDLVNYYKAVDEPVLLLFFGDHQPILEEGFYEEVMGKELNDLTDEENLARYTVPFVLWANYDIPEGTIDAISANYLSTLLLQTAGLPMPAYNEYLACLYQEVPVITAQGCLDSQGRYFAADNATALAEGDSAGLNHRKAKGRTPLTKEDAAKLQELLDGYHKVMYNNMTDTKGRVDKLFRIEQ